MQNSIPPSIGVGFLLKRAFGYWKKTIWYQAIFTMTYLSLLFLVVLMAGNHFGVLDKMIAIFSNTKTTFVAKTEALRVLQSTKEYTYYFMATVFGKAFLYPLNMGLLQIYKKIDLKEEYDLQDLFAGYIGSNFFKFFSYSFFWLFIFQLGAPTLILALVWVFSTLMVGPLMFFQNFRIFEGISSTLQLLRKHFMEVFVCVLVAFLFSYAGFLTVVGGLFTFPFWSALLYVLYTAFLENKN